MLERISRSSDVPDKSQNTTGEEVLTTNYYNSRPNASFRKLTVNSNLTSRLEAVPATLPVLFHALFIDVSTETVKIFENSRFGEKCILV